jgi:beta-glucosidase
VRKAFAERVLKEDLIRAIHEENLNTIVVLISSFPYAIRWSQEHAPASPQVAHDSQELVSAVADVLVADVNPAGRLTISWAKTLDQLPDLFDYDVWHGRAYMYLEEEPLDPFGHGLSCSIYEYGSQQLDHESIPADGVVTVSVDAANSSDRAGDEVVQLHVSHLTSQLERLRQELKGFKRIQLQPGDTRAVAQLLARTDFA